MCSYLCVPQELCVQVVEVLRQPEGAARVLVALKKRIPHTNQPRLKLKKYAINNIKLNNI